MNDTISIPRELAHRLLSDACNENWSDLNRLIYTKPSDGALTNEGAEPVAWRSKKSWEKTGWSLHLVDPDENMHVDAETHNIEPLYRHAPKVCTCPSGDGSLRWPCPVHPPEVKVVLPERKLIAGHLTVNESYRASGWNACLDQFKDLNS